jgi:hypothetical protein
MKYQIRKGVDVMSKKMIGYYEDTAGFWGAMFSDGFCLDQMFLSEKDAKKSLKRTFVIQTPEELITPISRLQRWELM